MKLDLYRTKTTGGAKVTNAELEQIARAVRARGLHATWIELMEFSASVAGLAEAYKGMLVSPAPKGSDAALQEELGRALAWLTSPEQLSMWESEVSECNSMNTVERR